MPFVAVILQLQLDPYLSARTRWGQTNTSVNTFRSRYQDHKGCNSSQLTRRLEPRVALSHKARLHAHAQHAIHAMCYTRSIRVSREPTDFFSQGAGKSWPKLLPAHPLPGTEMLPKSSKTNVFDTLGDHRGTDAEGAGKSWGQLLPAYLPSCVGFNFCQPLCCFFFRLMLCLMFMSILFFHVDVLYYCLRIASVHHLTQLRSCPWLWRIWSSCRKMLDPCVEIVLTWFKTQSCVLKWF